MAEAITVGTAGVKFVKDADTIMIGLSQTYNTASPLSLTENSAVAAYRPPATKKFIILKINVVNGDTNSRFIQLRYNTIINSALGTQVIYIRMPKDSTTTLNTYIEIPTNNYITSDSDSANCGINSLIGVELDN
jgi:hypothetical protein